MPVGVLNIFTVLINPALRFHLPRKEKSGVNSLSNMWYLAESRPCYWVQAAFSRGRWRLPEKLLQIYTRCAHGTLMAALYSAANWSEASNKIASFLNIHHKLPFSCFMGRIHHQNSFSFGVSTCCQIFLSLFPLSHHSSWRKVTIEAEFHGVVLSPLL